jgi:xanthine dehydrogenase accessory factor
LLEYIEASDVNIRVFSRLTDDLENHTKVSRVVDLGSGEISAYDRSSEEAVVMDDQKMVHSLSPMFRLLLLGAGDVAKFVAEMALALEYDVTLCDPRPNYLDNWNVDGVEKISRLPDDVVRDRFSNPYSGIIALAHDPRVDDMALMEALKTDAFYIGAMGSERTSAARRQRLPELNLSEDEINRLHAPIGFQIGSKTPAEIAISVMAEVTAVRHAAK